SPQFRNGADGGDRPGRGHDQAGGGSGHPNQRAAGDHGLSAVALGSRSGAMKLVTTVILTLVLLTLESVAVKYLGFSVSGMDVTIAIVAFLSLRANLVEGAFSSYAVGYLLDLMSGHPTGLYTFLAVFTFLIGRLAASLVEVRSALLFVIFTMAADLGHG